MVRDLDKESLDGIMDKYLKANGDKGQKMVMVYGLLQKVIIMMDSGSWIGNKEQEPSNIKTVLIKEIFLIFSSMDMDKKNLQMEIFTKDNIMKENLMEKVDINGVKVDTIKEIS